MSILKRVCSSLSLGHLASPGFAQTKEIAPGPDHGVFAWLTHNYLPRPARAVTFAIPSGSRN